MGIREMALGFAGALAGSILAALRSRRTLASAARESQEARTEIELLRRRLELLTRRATHDLRNPLTPIMVRGEMLRRLVRHHPEQLRQVEAILRAAARLGRLIEEMSAAPREALAP